jgi:hypothetical protein
VMEHVPPNCYPPDKNPTNSSNFEPLTTYNELDNN